MNNDPRPDEVGPLKLSLFGALFSIGIGDGMLVLTYIMIKAMVKLIRDNAHFSIKQIIISTIVFIVFFSSGTFFIKRGIRRLKVMFKAMSGFTEKHADPGTDPMAHEKEV